MSDEERKRCATCRYLDYFERDDRGDIDDQWWCRFMPTPVQVNPTHWCGQWEDEDSGWASQQAIMSLIQRWEEEKNERDGS